MDDFIRELERKVAESPGDVRLLIMLIIALLRAGRASEAAELLLTNLELLGEEAFTLVRQYPALADALRALLPRPTPTTPLPRFKLWNLLRQLLQFSASGIAEAGAVVLSGPLAILGGLLIAVPKKATLAWDWGGWWRDPCAELLEQINDAYAQQDAANTDFTSNPTRATCQAALTSAGNVSELCSRYLRDCPNEPGTLAKQLIQTEEDRISKYLDWLASH